MAHAHKAPSLALTLGPSIFLSRGTCHPVWLSLCVCVCVRGRATSSCTTLCAIQAKPATMLASTRTCSQQCVRRSRRSEQHTRRWHCEPLDRYRIQHTEYSSLHGQFQKLGDLSSGRPHHCWDLFEFIRQWLSNREEPPRILCGRCRNLCSREPVCSRHLLEHCG